MKKIFGLVLVALFISAMSVWAGGPTGPNASGDILGQNKYQSDPGRIFRLVHVSPDVNDSNGLAAESIVVWDDSLDDGVSVETSTTTGDSRVAGILATTILSNDTSATQATAAADVGENGNWGWLQTYGYAKVTTNASTVSGGAMGCSNTAGKAALFTDAASSTACGNAGFFFDATTAGDDAECFINLD